jgi:hypothetical protein
MAEVKHAATRGADAVLDLLRIRLLDAEAAAWCCDAIACLIASQKATPAAFFQNGAGPALILRCMSQFQKDERLQTKAAVALTALGKIYGRSSNSRHGRFSPGLFFFPGSSHYIVINSPS